MGVPAVPSNPIQQLVANSNSWQNTSRNEWTESNVDQVDSCVTGMLAVPSNPIQQLVHMMGHIKVL